MGKVRTRILGLEDVEKKQKKEQKQRRLEKKSSKAEVVEKAHFAKASRSKEVGVKTQDQEEVKKGPESVKVKKVIVKKTKKIRGKKYQKAKKLVDKEKKYTLTESLELLKKMKYVKFDEAIELHMNLTAKGLRGEVSLPNPIGKETRAVVVNDKLLDDIENGIIAFDVLITEPSYMPKLAKFAKTLGPRGLMPSPKTGTISDKPQEVLKKYTGGFIKWKSEAEAPLLHQMVGKVSHGDKKITENVKALIQAVGKPQIEAVFIKTSMSPSVKLDLEEL